MQNKMEIADAFCKAVDIIVDRKLEKLAFNYTIVGQIQQVNSEMGTYDILYQDKIFTARALDIDQIYKVNDYVYILVPNNAENRTRYIMGTVQISNTTLIQRISDLEQEINLLKKKIGEE